MSEESRQPLDEARARAGDRLVYEFTHSHRVQGWLVVAGASVSYGKATSDFSPG